MKRRLIYSDGRVHWSTCCWHQLSQFNPRGAEEREWLFCPHVVKQRDKNSQILKNPTQQLESKREETQQISLQPRGFGSYTLFRIYLNNINIRPLRASALNPDLYPLEKPGRLKSSIPDRRSLPKRCSIPASARRGRLIVARVLSTLFLEDLSRKYGFWYRASRHQARRALA